MSDFMVAPDPDDMYEPTRQVVTTRAAARRSGRRGYFGVAVYRPKTSANVGSLWRSSVLFGASFLATVGHRYQRQPSDTEHAAQHTPLIHFDDMDALIEHLPYGCALTGVELDGRAQSLDSWAHPDRTLYLLGAEDDGIPRSVLNRCHHVVQIPCPTPRSMNVACAGSILLFDRHIQRKRLVST